MDKYTLEVFNTITEQYEMVEVTEELYKVYMRDFWSTKQKNKRYYKHNISASFITKGDDEFFEKYDSFVDACEDSHRLDSYSRDIRDIVTEAMKTLSTRDRKMIHALFYEEVTEKEYAKKMGISQQAVHKKKKKILRHLKKEMEKFS